jgi:hypothetical protein
MAVQQGIGSEIAGNLDQIADLLDSKEAAKFTHEQLRGTLETFNQWFVRISELRRTVIAMMAVEEYRPGEYSLQKVVQKATQRVSPPCEDIEEA